VTIYTVVVICDSADCDCDEIFRRPYFPDGEHLDAAVVEPILRPYPALWEQWKAAVLVPDAMKDTDRAGLKRYHSPTYLRAVIRQHLHLSRGGDRPDPRLAARCEEIVSGRPEIAEDRRHVLDDPWQRAVRDLSDTVESVVDLYDPKYLQSKVDYANKLDDAFSREAIRSARNEIIWDGERKASAPDN